MAEKSATTLLSLPTELHLAITEHLSPHSTTWLALTCKPLYHNLAPCNKLSSRALALLILEHLDDPSATPEPSAADTASRKTKEGRFACFHCHTLQPRSAFALKQTTRSRGKGPLHAHATKRFCIACGVWKGIYGAGNEIIRVNGSKAWLCASCRRFHGEREVSCKGCMQCLACAEVAREAEKVRRRVRGEVVGEVRGCVECERREGKVEYGWVVDDGGSG